ncbi:PilN domain-containing protein [Comamonas sp.]|uniref:PilN domain-containing protein n=1 Tax=Comamonas sp. TaxID=34028 RepID=UPI00258CA7A7|nr:PilN domain-containing protein [Comamonas sp.]
MPKLNAEAKLFGMDLGHLAVEFQMAWQQLAEVLRLERWLPFSKVQVQHVSQGVYEARVRGSRWLSDTQTASKQSVETGVKPSVIVLDEQYFLLRQLMLPRMPAAMLKAAMYLEVQAASPFGAEDTLWEFRKEIFQGDRALAGQVQQQSLNLVITSKSLVRTALEVSNIKNSGGELQEVWLGLAQQPPILLTGYGEQGRLRKEQRQNRALIAGGVILAFLIAIVAITPTIQLRARAIDATQQLQLLAQRTTEQVAQRQQLMSAVQALEDFDAAQSMQIDHLLLLQRLTEILPDDVVLQSMNVKGQTLTLQGIGDNASAVVQLLAAAQGFKEVRLPSAVTRVPNLNKENFALAAELDPAFFSLQGKAGSLAPAAAKDQS